ncbi:hypothetical protein IGS68_27160 [Skermanella sp. TT6]|uniref:Uncharacterized protein n=1 Tax=Skermanella cutis TaxID=2775420 RepID=A0ABX7B5K9_9PROT|nr:hypothetical protein [Skermanella sp. TT6]QQP89602.2 hypothetical protein IGS68_27160 [Skermanella sp. TT6]
MFGVDMMIRVVQRQQFERRRPAFLLIESQGWSHEIFLPEQELLLAAGPAHHRRMGPGTVVIFGIWLKQQAWIFGYPVRFDAVLCAGLLLVGVGLSINTLARSGPG